MSTCALFVAGYFREEIADAFLTINIKKFKALDPNSLQNITIHQEAYDGFLYLVADDMEQLETNLIDALSDDYVHTVIILDNRQRTSIEIFHGEGSYEEILSKYAEILANIVKEEFGVDKSSIMIFDHRDNYLLSYMSAN